VGTGRRCPPQFADLDQDAKRALAEFLDAAVVVDPAEYRRQPGEPTDPAALTLPFGPHAQGSVTFLVYPPDDLVLVIKIQWIGD
jgi:hypothetical protein